MREDLGNDRRIYDACPEPAEGACPEPAEGAAMIVKGPPHFGQAVMSISNTRFSIWAQLRRLCAERVGSSLGSALGAAFAGTICRRRAELGARTPWKRMR